MNRRLVRRLAGAALLAAVSFFFSHSFRHDPVNDFIPFLVAGIEPTNMGAPADTAISNT